MAKKKQQHRNKKKKNRNQKAAASSQSANANAADSDSRDVAAKNYVDSLLTNSDNAMKKYTNLTEEEWANVSKEDMKKVCDKSKVWLIYFLQ